jgi:hypothetical protein
MVQKEKLHMGAIWQKHWPHVFTYNLEWDNSDVVWRAMTGF